MGLKALSTSGGGGGGGGTVTSVSVVSAHGLAGTVATSTTTPAITLSTTVTGLVIGDGTTLSAVPNSTVDATSGATQLLPLSVTVSGTTKTLVLTDANSIQACSNASAQVITIPLNASVAFPIGTVVQFEQDGAGSVTATGAVGVTINGNNAGSAGVAQQNSAFYLRKTGTDAWLAIGAALITRAFVFNADGLGSALATGTQKSGITIPFTGTILSWYLEADQSGSIVIDIKRSGTSIIGGGNSPTLSSAQSGNAAASGWTSVAVTKGDILNWSITSITSITNINLVVTFTQTGS